MIKKKLKIIGNDFYKQWSEIIEAAPEMFIKSVLIVSILVGIRMVLGIWNQDAHPFLDSFSLWIDIYILGFLGCLFILIFNTSGVAYHALIFLVDFELDDEVKELPHNIRTSYRNEIAGMLLSILFFLVMIILFAGAFHIFKYWLLNDGLRYINYISSKIDRFS